MMRVVLLLLVGLSLVCLPACNAQTQTAAPAPNPSTGFDDYQVIMWVLGDIPRDQDLYFSRLRDAGVTGIHIGVGDSPAPAESHGFGYYVENIHRIAFLHDKERIYRADWDGYTKTRDKKYLIRKPSLNDPAYLASAKQEIQSRIRPYAQSRPLLYDLGDECSITSFASPMDYDFSPYALAAFRDWLKQQYGTLDRLNAEWGTKFAAWDDVVPMTTYEIKDRERAGSENYSPWADHRTFMDLSFAEAWRKFRGWAHEVDPRTPVGIEGAQMPSAFGGYDLWRLSQVLDWVEPYDIGESHGIFRSFLPPGTPVLATVFEHEPNPMSRRLWHLLLNGDRGCIIWASSEWFDYNSPELKPKPWVEGMSKVFAELRGPAAKAIMHAQRDRAPIALHYSHPSIQVGWMLDSREDGDTWPRRFSSYESVHSRITRVRSSWCRLLEDLGLQYDFVSTQQILDGTLAKRGYKALILPESLAIGDAEAAKITDFARGGSAVIADFLPGVFDEHGKRRAVGVLDDFFEVHRPPKGTINQPERSLVTGTDEAVRGVPAEEWLTASKSNMAPMLLHRAARRQAYYLNVSPIEYARLRLEGKGGELRKAIGDLLAQAGAKPAVRVSIADGPPIGCEVITYHSNGKRYVAIMRNPEYNVSELGELGYGNNRLFEQPATVNLTLDAAADAKELLTGQEFKGAKSFEVRLQPWKPVIVELR